MQTSFQSTVDPALTVYGVVDENGIEWVVGSAGALDVTGRARVISVYDRRVLDFLIDLSRSVLTDRTVLDYPDLVAFGSWCLTVANTDPAEHVGAKRLGRGVVFHVGPSSIPLMFAYSLVAGLLAGNANVVRLPSERTWQVGRLCDAFAALLAHDRYRAIVPLIQLVRYDHTTTAATAWFSSLCHVRVIWGGNATIDRIRKHPIRPEAIELSFFDRRSIAVIRGEAWLACVTKDKVLHDFYNDTYLTDQVSCSSPRALIWVGERTEAASHDFWRRFSDLVRARYLLNPMSAVEKLRYALQTTAENEGARILADDNYVVRIQAQELHPGLVDDNPGAGCFIESSVPTLVGVAPLLERQCQTISYFGFAPHEFDSLLETLTPHGVDRIVPIGQTLSFSLFWDGYDMIGCMSRTVQIS